ncbi:MAG: bifunctional oligoribonuclease/PAP phosphatase NrnA [Candidatus Muirbacterium halophilum]|nr:bifunctional oligoribonuclease/PAP phosphatase NrnA [Candidatus Muirbacterium halophilum]MCK9474733.1 bifunctional oligoribonuclease/PAP phosphatase NrnA [Candidatus Muirbacterium halophilum]
MDIFQQIIKFFRTGTNFLIVPHKRPDGDAIGSSLALHRIIKLVNKNSAVFIPEEIPESFRFLIVNDDIIVQDENILSNYDIVITLDSSNLDRTYVTRKIIDNSNIIINIDHHKTNDSFGDINLVMPDSSSTCEIILKLSKVGYLPLTPNIANCLLTGIFTDTGFFRNQNVTDATFESAAELIRFGADHETLISKLLQSKTVDDLKFHSEAMLKSEFSYQKQVGWIVISKELMKKYNINDYRQVWGTGIIGFLNNISHVEVSYYFIEVSDNETIIEYRAKNPHDVSIIAKHFGGGGHKLASGCTINENIELAQKKVFDYFFNNYSLM